MIKRGDMVRITEQGLTPNLRGEIGKVVRVPTNNHYIVKFKGDSNLYIFGEKEVEVLPSVGK